MMTKIINRLDAIAQNIGKWAFEQYNKVSARVKQRWQKDKFMLPQMAENISKIPNKVNSWLKNTHNREILREKVIQKRESAGNTLDLSKCIPLRTYLMYFISLPFALMLTTLVAFYLIKPIPTALNDTQHITAPIVQPTVDEIDKLINTANSLPMTYPPVSKINTTAIAHTSNQLEYVAITINKSIFLSGKRAGLSGSMVRKFMDIFSSEINFTKDVHNNDKAIFLYKKTPVVVKKKKTTYENVILAAELILHNKAYKAIRFTDSDGRTAYYTPKGVNLKPSLVRAPLNYKRISSRFSYHRFNPVLGFYRAHLGVDFAAPIGTPIAAAGDGRVAFVGYKGGYGRAVIIQHNNKYSTLYGHLLRYAKNLTPGTYVHKNQLIAYVGSSGESTGPHLHYEVRAYNVQHDPLSIKLPHFAISNTKDRAKFFSLAKTLLAQLRTNFPQYAVNTDYEFEKAAHEG